eukprot:XP_012824910.1 PREDICTED: CD48 antigen-like [Xenopus tropicalis]
MNITGLLVILCLSFLMTYATGGGGDVPLPVTGRVGETASLLCPLNLTDPIVGVSWMFCNNGKKILLGVSRNQKFIRVNENYFPNRLEGSDGTALLIRELRMEDSGNFTALFLVNGEMKDISYNLTVLEPLPIPTPVIEKTLDGNSPDLCHLHCSVPLNSPTLSYSWTYRDTGTDRLYANGSTITVSLKDKALGAEFTCWVQNPAHRNSTSVPLYPCAQTEVISPTGRVYWLSIIAMSLIGAILVIIIKAVYYRTQIMQDKKTPKDKIVYAGIQHNNHDISQGMSSQNNTGNCKKNENIVYAELSTNNGMHGEV